MEQAQNRKRDERDRISSLADCLIHLIMSFLTAQQAVRTCILSKRWKNIWTTLPFLDFDLSKFEYDEESVDSEWEYDDIERDKINKFREFVNTTLLLREASNLHKFRLSCYEWFALDEYATFIRSCILYALKHNPQVLNIHFIPVDSRPIGVLTCASLVEASFSSFSSVQTIKVINLPCLRRLHLRWIYLEQDFVDKLFCGCPILEFLHLEDCRRFYSTINSQSLKYLTIENISLGVTVEKEMQLFP